MAETEAPDGLKPDVKQAFETGDIALALRARQTWVLEKARPKQLPPPGDDWDTIVWLGGRFMGKTRPLSEITWWECFAYPGLRVHALGPTKDDVRKVTFEGESGVLACCPPELVRDYNRSTKELYFNNGSMILGFGMTDEADRLRGPQCHMMTVDEAAAADKPKGNLEKAYDVATLGCRLPHPNGRTPARSYVATTPRPLPFLRKLIKRPKTIVVRGTSHENLANVSQTMRDKIMLWDGTKFGRQEIYGEILDDEEGAIFHRQWFRLWPNGKKLPEFAFITASLDTAFEEENYDAKGEKDPDYSACAILGVFNIAQVFNAEERKRMKLTAKYAAVLCDFWMERLGFPELLEKTRLTYRTKYGSPGRYPDVVLIEKKASGISLRQSLIKFGVPTWGFDPGQQGKTMRANAASPYVLQGHLFVPESSLPYKAGLPRDWVEPLLEQMCAYQGEGSVEYDDGLDAVVQAILDLARRNFFTITPQGTQHPDPDEKDEAEQKRAMAAYEREKRGATSPYGS